MADSRVSLRCEAANRLPLNNFDIRNTLTRWIDSIAISPRTELVARPKVDLSGMGRNAVFERSRSRLKDRARVQGTNYLKFRVDVFVSVLCFSRMVGSARRRGEKKPSVARMSRLLFWRAGEVNPTVRCMYDRHSVPPHATLCYMRSTLSLYLVDFRMYFSIACVFVFVFSAIVSPLFSFEKRAAVLLSRAFRLPLVAAGETQLPICHI